VTPSPANRTAAPACTLRMAEAEDREEIYRARHEVYARELGQHRANGGGRLTDALDGWNRYIVARGPSGLLGFVSITPPGSPSLSLDKYFRRESLPFPVDGDLHEVRLLTVLRPHRGREVALLLMHAALRWVESHGGTRIAAIGRREILDFYLRVGLRRGGLSARSGAVTYDLLHGTVGELQAARDGIPAALERLRDGLRWDLPFPFARPAACLHGGASFRAVGERFDRPGRRAEVIAADVLDAWYPPAPGVLRALAEDPAWLLRTSPPTACGGFLAAVAEARGVAPECLVPGAGSSDLVFRALLHWLDRSSRVLLLDPTYGEYAHVLGSVVGARVERLALREEEGFVPDPDRLAAALASAPDLAVIVNPNSPTGRHVPRSDLEAVLARAPGRTRIWLDETYVEHAGPEESLERFAARSEGVLVCKSMSKIYALSGARVAYLCGGRHQVEAIRALTPPWAMGLPSQVAGVKALEDPGYYAGRIRETRVLRCRLAEGLHALGWRPVPGVANFLLCRIPDGGPGAASWVQACARRDLFLRDAGAMGTSLGDRFVRVAVKDAATQERLLAILREVRDGFPPPRSA